jgi:hypothetical protein
LAKRYVVRGLESGGAVGDVGRYVSFAGEEGQPIEYLHPVETIGVNGVHAVVMAPGVVRIDMLRKGRTYELLKGSWDLCVLARKSPSRDIGRVMSTKGNGRNWKPRSCFAAFTAGWRRIYQGGTKPKRVR